MHLIRMALGIIKALGIIERKELLNAFNGTCILCFSVCSVYLKNIGGCS